MSNITDEDLDNLKQLKLAKRQHETFGVGTDPTITEDQLLYESMLRLESAGLVVRSIEDEFGIWWQAKEVKA